MDKVKLCRDCKHLMLGDKCRMSPQPMDFVSGADGGYFYAQTERMTMYGCGKEAKFFEPKEGVD